MFDFVCYGYLSRVVVYGCDLMHLDFEIITGIGLVFCGVCVSLCLLALTSCAVLSCIGVI